MGLSWRGGKTWEEAIQHWRLQVSTVCQTYHVEGLRAEYVTGCLAGAPVPTFSEMVDEGRSCVLFVAHLADGDMLCIHKGRLPGLFVLLHQGHLQFLSADLAPFVRLYQQGDMTVERLLAQSWETAF
jgi:hypothetical protein